MDRRPAGTIPRAILVVKKSTSATSKSGIISTAIRCVAHWTVRAGKTRLLVPSL